MTEIKMSNSDDENRCPICMTETSDFLKLGCGHEACPSCTWRIVATTKRCWHCRQEIQNLSTSDGTQIWSDESDPLARSEGSQNIGLQFGSQTLRAVIFVIDYKVAAVSCVAGMMAMWFVSAV